MKDLVIKRLLRRSGKNGKGVYVIYFRYQLMWDGIRYPYFENSSKLSITSPKQWDFKVQQLKGSSESVRRFNKKVLDKQNAIESYWKKFSVNNNVLDFIRLKTSINALMGGKDAGEYDKQEPVYIPALFDLHIEAGKPKGGEYNKSRQNRYKFMKRMAASYCLHKFNSEKVALDKLSKPFYNDFRRYMQKKLALKQTTLQGYMKVFAAAVNSEWDRGEYTTKNPFNGCITDGGKSTRIALTLPELNRIKSLSDDQLGENVALARDIFLFACYSGISYCDLKALTSQYIQVLEGEMYLVKDREKNNNHSHSNFFSVPINEDLRALLDKFKKHPKISGTDFLIPISSNSDYNKQLKLIKAHAGIRKNVSSHISRHTFACLFIEGGGSTEVLMKMLGHSRISQTLEYAKITAKRVSKEARDAQQYISNRDAKIIPISSMNKNVNDGAKTTGG